ncbi:MAG: HDIG domain-containing protein [Chloroflexi bacterium]|nr:HDIG domain-containing protein [Chloroflexota bacterium]
MLKRLRQVLNHGRTATEADYGLAREHLPPRFFTLFEAQTPRDIVHAAGTARWLLARGYTDADLIAAALLHDIGKGDQRLRDRVAFVVFSRLGVATRLADPDSRLRGRRAVARSRDHSRAGADVLRRNGASERLVDLTARHHADPREDVVLALLQQADAAN